MPPTQYKAPCPNKNKGCRWSVATRRPSQVQPNVEFHLTKCRFENHAEG